MEMQRVDGKLCDKTLIESIDLDVWQLLAAEVGGIIGIEDNYTYSAIFDALTSRHQYPLLIQALQTIAELGTEDGKEAIEKCFRDQQISLSNSDNDPMTFAARAWLLSRTSDSAAKALQYAYFQADDRKE